MKRLHKNLLVTGIIFCFAQTIFYPSLAGTENDAVNIQIITDINRKHWAFPAIQRVVQELGILMPKTPTQFMGKDFATRYEVANAFYIAARKLEVISGFNLKAKNERRQVEMTDLEPGSKQIIESVVNQYGLMQVFAGNRFLGNKKITRYELAFELDNYLGLLERTTAKTTRPPVKRAENFIDLKSGHWATQAIFNIVNKYQVMSGYPDNRFKGENPLTRYELVSVLKRFVDYVDKYLIYIPKYVPLPEVTPVPTPTPTPIPMPTPVISVPTPTPTPIPAPTPNTKTPLYPFDIRAGVRIKTAFSEGFDIRNDMLSGPSLIFNAWFPKLGDFRFGLGVNGYLMSYGKILSDSNKVNNLRRTTVGADFDWKILGADYADDLSLYAGVGYEILSWTGANYNYSNHGPKIKAVLEVPFQVPFINSLSVFFEEQFIYFPFSNTAFNYDLMWKNDIIIGLNFPALSTFSFQIGYTDTRYSLFGKGDINGDLGGIANLRARF